MQTSWRVAIAAVEIRSAALARSRGYWRLCVFPGHDCCGTAGSPLGANALVSFSFSFYNIFPQMKGRRELHSQLLDGRLATMRTTCRVLRCKARRIRGKAEPNERTSPLIPQLLPRTRHQPIGNVDRSIGCVFSCSEVCLSQ